MILKLIQIGNSRGIRLPKKLIEKFSFYDEVELEIKKDGLFLRNKKEPRAGWRREILDEVNKLGSPGLLIPDNLDNEFDNSEWQW